MSALKYLLCSIHQSRPLLIRMAVQKPQLLFFSANADGEAQKNFVSEEEFPPLRLFAHERKALVRRKLKSQEVRPARAATMKPDQDWTNVWPAARSYHPATVPLPVRMGTPPHKGTPTVDKWGNAELMKIPNLLHLAPPAVAKHTAAIRKFCSPWPEGVSYASSVMVVKKPNPEPTPVKSSKTKLPMHDPDPDSVFNDPGYFPMAISKKAYVFSGPSIRDVDARIVTMKIRLEDLQLNDHSYDKLLRLARDRYDRETHTIHIIGDRCPLYSQNFNYCNYLLTVVLAESQTKEPWEHEKMRRDCEEFEYDGSSSQTAVAALRARQKESGVPVVTEELEQRYDETLTKLLNDGETDESIRAYSESVLAILGISKAKHDTVSTHNPTLGRDTGLPDITIKSYYEKINVVWQECGWYPFIPR